MLEHSLSSSSSVLEEGMGETTATLLGPGLSSLLLVLGKLLFFD